MVSGCTYDLQLSSCIFWAVGLFAKEKRAKRCKNREMCIRDSLNCLDKNADWFQLAKGDNIFAYTAEYGSTNLQFKIENRIVYEGV